MGEGPCSTMGLNTRPDAAWTQSKGLLWTSARRGLAEALMLSELRVRFIRRGSNLQMRRDALR